MYSFVLAPKKCAGYIRKVMMFMQFCEKQMEKLNGAVEPKMQAQYDLRALLTQRENIKREKNNKALQRDKILQKKSEV